MPNFSWAKHNALKSLASKLVKEGYNLNLDVNFLVSENWPVQASTF